MYEMKNYKPGESVQQTWSKQQQARVAWNESESAEAKWSYQRLRKFFCCCCWCWTVAISVIKKVQQRRCMKSQLTWVFCFSSFVIYKLFLSLHLLPSMAASWAECFLFTPPALVEFDIAGWRSCCENYLTHGKKTAESKYETIGKSAPTHSITMMKF